MPLPAAPAGPSFGRRGKPGRAAAVWSTALALAAAYLGPDRFFTLRFAGAFCLAALLQFGFARAAFERFVPSPAEMRT